MKRTLPVSLSVCILLTACGSPRSIPTIIPSAIPTATLVPTSTPTSVPTTELPPTPTQRPTSTPRPTIIGTLPAEPPLTPTFTPFPPYHTKGVVFAYYVIGNYADWGEFFDPPSGNIVTRLILYNDGQMLIAGANKTYKQKFLLPDEVKGFLSKLDAMGFFSLESNQQHDPTDKLYNYGDHHEETFDGLHDCISVDADKSRDLCVYDSDRQYLIPEMQNILKYLDEYKPTGMTPYYPDRIFLSIRLADPSSDTLPATATPWNKRFPSLEFSRPQKYVYDFATSTVYVNGNMAKEVYLFFENSHSSGIFTQNGKEYIVDIRVLLPHEKIRNAYQ